MGLFNFRKKDEKTAYITEFIPEEDLQKITDVIQPKLRFRGYVAVYEQLVIKQLNAYATGKKKAYNYRQLAEFAKILEESKKIEPSFEPVFQSGIEKIQERISRDPA